MSTRVEADNDFSVTDAGERMEGVLRGSGEQLTLDVSDPKLLGGSGAAAARVLAAGLAEQGLRLTITADRPLVTLGVPRAPFLHRRVTGSPHIRVASLAAALRLLRLRGTTPTRTPLVPPATPLPVVPTFLRRPKHPTTTHDPDRGGYPRLVTTPGPHPGPEDHRTTYLLGDRTVVGSHPSCDVVLPGLHARHAEIVRTEDDELFLRPVQPGGARVHGAVVHREALLRTGARVELGGWSLV